MEGYSTKELKEIKNFIEHIKWDVTPKILFEPRFPSREKQKATSTNNIDGYQ